MKGRIKHYSSSRYRSYRRQIDRRALILIGAAVAILLISILLGAFLNSRVDDYEDSERGVQQAPSPVPNSYGAYPKIEVSLTAAMLIPTDAYASDNALDRALTRASDKGARGMSFELTDSRGVPRYSSALYRDTFASSGGKVDLARFVAKAASSDIAVCAVIQMYSLSEQEGSSRSLRYALELALISEAYRAGVRDIVICGAEGMSEQDMYSMMQCIRAESPELAVGILVPLTPEQAADITYMSAIGGIFDYIALDLSDALAQDACEEGTVPEQGTGELGRCLNALRYPLSRYPSRVLVRAGNGCTHCTDYAIERITQSSAGGYILVGSEQLH